MKNIAQHYFYDGSFNGFLTTMHSVAYENMPVATLMKKVNTKDVLFPEPNYICTCPEAAQQIWDQLRVRNYGALKAMYFAFMSEAKGIENLLMDFFRDILRSETSGFDRVSASKHSRIYQLACDVEREKNALERQLRIKENTDAPFVRAITPKYNILPLISKYFRTRYRISEWVIWDMKRKYGLYHQEGKVGFIPCPPAHKVLCKKNTTHSFNTTDRKRDAQPLVAVA